MRQNAIALEWTKQAVNQDERAQDWDGDLNTAPRSWLHLAPSRTAKNFVSNLPYSYMSTITTASDPKRAYIGVVVDSLESASMSDAVADICPRNPVSPQQVTGAAISFAGDIVRGSISELVASEYVTAKGYEIITPENAVKEFDEYDVPSGKSPAQVLDESYGIDFISSCGTTFQVKSSNVDREKIDADFLIVVQDGNPKMRKC